MSTLFFLLLTVNYLGLRCHCIINLKNDNRFVVLLDEELQSNSRVSHTKQYLSLTTKQNGI